jgi:opacity protein-like surface antigen
VLVCASAFCALAAAQASAALPEIGRCEKLAGTPTGKGKRLAYDGHYKNRACTKESATDTGRYEFLAGTGENKEYENPGSLEAVTLVTAAGTAIDCKNHKSFGEITGAKTETNSLTLYECEDTNIHEPCQTLISEDKPQEEQGKIGFEPLEGELGFVNKSGKKPLVGWELKPKTGSLIALFECGATKGLGTKVTLEGSVIGEIKPVDRPHEEFKESFVATAGHQEPEEFEGGTATGLKAMFLSGLELHSEAIGYTTKEEVITEEDLVIKGIA